MTNKSLANSALVSAFSKFEFVVKKGWKWLPLIHLSISVSVDGSKHIIKFVSNSLLQENHFLSSA